MRAIAMVLFVTSLLPLAWSDPLQQPGVQPLSFEQISFEQGGAAFLAHSEGRVLEVDGSKATIRSAAGILQMRFAGSSPGAVVSGSEHAGTLNRFIGQDPTQWRIGIPLFGEVSVSRIYPGIDLKVHGCDTGLEYDFVVSPQADPGRIRVAMNGEDSAQLTPGGDLEVHLGETVLTQHRPIAFQIVDGKRRDVSSRFAMDGGGQFHFAMGDYDHALPLTIDPAVNYASYLGGSAADLGHGVAVDSSNDFYIVGQTYSTTNTNSNVLLEKITPAGARVQSIFGGTNGTDTGNAVAVDSSGNVYVAGSTSSTNFPVGGTSGYTYQPTLAGLGATNAFVTSLDAANTSVNFSTYFGGSYVDEAFGIAIGPASNVFIVGDTTSPNFSLITSQAFQLYNYGGANGYDAFLVAFTDLGVPIYGTYIGGTGDDHAYSVAVDSSGNAYVVGSTASSTEFPVSPYPGFPQPFQQTLHGVQNAFAIEIFYSNPGTEAYWGTYIGGEGQDSANSVVLDSSNNLYIAGTTSSTEFPVFPVPGGYQTVFQGGTSDGFVISLQANGQGRWSTYLGGAGDDVLNGLVLDGAGDIWVAGASDGSFPVTSTAIQSANAGGQDATLSELSITGANLLYSTYFGGSGNDVATGLAIDSNGRLYLGGTTASSNNDLPVAQGVLGSSVYQATYGGGTSDIFFAAFGCPATLPAIASGGVGNAASYATSTVSPGGIIAIFGTNLACTTASATALPLATTLGGTTVDVNGTAIPLYYVSAGQVNAQMPYNVPVGSATMTVTTANGTSSAVSVPIVEAGPGIFNGSGVAIAENQDYTVNSSSNPAKAGSYVVVFFTGEGPLSGSLTTGAATPSTPIFSATLANSATIDGEAALVYFMGAAPGFAGLAQANLQVPAGLATGSYPVVITINGVSSQAATISVTE